MSSADYAWRSRRGIFTLVRGLPGGGLIPQEITEAQAKAVRVLDGFIFDREGLAEMEAKRQCTRLDAGKFVQIGKYSVFVLVRERKIDV